MANEKELRELHSIIEIDGDEYSITAAKVANTLVLNTNPTSPNTPSTNTFDGSSQKAIDLYNIKVNQADKVANQLTIKVDGKEEGTFDGSQACTVDIKTTTVKTDFGDGTYHATIMISKAEPSGGNSGDIWFKYKNN